MVAINATPPMANRSASSFRLCQTKRLAVLEQVIRIGVALLTP
jgi:hypothetical protein